MSYVADECTLRCGTLQTSRQNGSRSSYGRAGRSRFRRQNRSEVYAWVQETLEQQEYFAKTKKERGVIRAYLSKISGRSLSPALEFSWTVLWEHFV